MAEYLPLFTPGKAFTLKASATIVGRQLLAVTGVGTVGPAGAASAAWVGVASNDAAVNDNLTVFAEGVQELTASGAITAGDAVIPGAAGTVATNASPTTQNFVGIALNTAANAALVRVKMAR